MGVKFFAALLLGCSIANANCIDVGTHEVVAVRTDRGHIVAERYAFGGKPLDEQPLLVSDMVAQQVSPAIAFDGEKHLVVWLLNGDVVGRFLLPDARVDSALIRFTASAAADRVTVAWMGDEYLVAWNGPHASASTLSKSGTSMNALQIFGGDAVSGDIVIAGDRDRALVAYAWAVHDSTERDSIRTIRLSHHDTRGHSRVVASPARGEVRLVVAPWGYLLAWADGDRVVVQRLDADGTPHGRWRLVDGTSARIPESFVAVVSDGGTPFVIAGNGKALYGGRVFESSFDDPSVTTQPMTAQDENGCASPISAVLLPNESLAAFCGSVRFFAAPVPIVQ